MTTTIALDLKPRAILEDMEIPLHPSLRPPFRRAFMQELASRFGADGCVSPLDFKTIAASWQRTYLHNAKAWFDSRYRRRRASLMLPGHILGEAFSENPSNVGQPNFRETRRGIVFNGNSRREFAQERKIRFDVLEDKNVRLCSVTFDL